MDTESDNSRPKTNRFVDIILLILTGCLFFVFTLWLLRFIGGEMFDALMLTGLVALLYSVIKKNKKEE